MTQSCQLYAFDVAVGDMEFWLVIAKMLCKESG
jgi:hypothetical protein